MATPWPVPLPTGFLVKRGSTRISTARPARSDLDREPVRCFQLYCGTGKAGKVAAGMPDSDRGNVYWIPLFRILEKRNIQVRLAGTTGPAIMDAILAGERDRQILAKLRDWRIKASE